MRYSSAVLALLSLSGAVAQPHKEHHHMHQRHHEKRAVEWTTTWEIVTETLSITTTIWVDGDATSVEQSTTTSPVSATSTSTTHSPAEFHESSTTTTPPVAPTTLVSVAAYTPPAPSTSSSVYVPPAAPTSTSVAPVDPVTTPVYVAPTTSQAPYVAPDPTTPAPAAATTPPASSSSSSGGTCSSGSPCTGDITYYQAGLGACGITSDGDNDLVIALPHELMGTQSNGNPYCGKTVTITKDGTSITATVVDKCMGCDGYSIDLSNKAFSSLGVAYAVGRTQATWYFND